MLSKFKIPVLALTSTALLMVFYLQFGHLLSSSGSIFNIENVESFSAVLGKVEFYFLIFGISAAAFASTKRAWWLLLPMIFVIPYLIAYGPFVLYFFALYAIEPALYFIGSIVICLILGLSYDYIPRITAFICLLAIAVAGAIAVKESSAIKALPIYQSFGGGEAYDFGTVIQDRRREVIKTVVSSKRQLDPTMIADEFERSIRENTDACKDLSVEASRQSCYKLYEEHIKRAVDDIKLFLNGFYGTPWRAHAKVIDLKVGNGELLDLFSPFTLCVNASRGEYRFNPRGGTQPQDVFKGSYAYDDLWMADMAQGMREGGIRRFYISEEEEGYTISITADVGPYSETCYHPDF